MATLRTLFGRGTTQYSVAELQALDNCDDPALVMTVRDLAAGYNGHRALEAVSFDVEPGERIGVIGPYGAGKSTLLKAIVGLLPHQGAISIQGASCHQSHTMVGYVPQHEAIDWTFPATVWDVVMMGRARQVGYILPPRPRDRQAVRSALERVGMWHLRKRQIGQLSGGQRRRVFVARALAQQASVLLLDEPFSGIDATAESEIFQVLDVLREEAVAVLLATHNLAQAATHYDKLIMLNGGHLVAYGAADAVYTPENLAATFGDRIVLFQQDDGYVVVADKPCHEHEHSDHDHHH
ncbi:MAG: metal ABC transporter ATP-binding protein [Chloroflexi bacterium]|nr:metal ABC transporter ATP-binding protein [Chloroflexota bacterium]